MCVCVPESVCEWQNERKKKENSQKPEQIFDHKFMGKMYSTMHIVEKWEECRKQREKKAPLTSMTCFIPLFFNYHQISEFGMFFYVP